MIGRTTDGDTAGRDRTGVLAGILHGVAGTSPSASQLDYLISRIGTEPRRTELMMLVANSLGAGDKDAAGLENLASLRPSFWTLFIEGMQREYGDWDGYVRWLGFSDKDIAVIRSNLREQHGRL
jgi:protein tyrosine/serine phosphatase